MSQADQIREFVSEKYLKPAKDKGTKQIKIRAGDVHDEMGFSNKIPSVCGALDTKKFLKQNNMELVNREGPTCGANVFYTFRFLSKT